REVWRAGWTRPTDPDRALAVRETPIAVHAGQLRSPSPGRSPAIQVAAPQAGGLRIGRLPVRHGESRAPDNAANRTRTHTIEAGRLGPVSRLRCSLTAPRGTRGCVHEATVTSGVRMAN